MGVKELTFKVSFNIECFKDFFPFPYILFTPSGAQVTL